MADPLSLGDRAAFKRLQVRHLTSLGNLVDFPVTAGVATLAVTFPMAEAKVSFGVVALPNWLTTVRVTTKTRTGFTLDFGTVAPANASLDICTFRSEI